MQTESPSSSRSFERSGNELLAAMSTEDLGFIAARGSRLVIALDQVISRAGQTADTVLFVEHGVASVAKLEADGRKTEICLVGPEGFTGAGTLLDDGPSPYEIYSQSPALQAVEVSSAALRELYARSPDAKRILNRAVVAQMNQIAENLASAVRQQMGPRLARWLLMYRERLRSDRIEVTHAYMAIMIGSQRSKVTEALHDLEARGAIAASRGLVLVINQAVLKIVAAHGFATSDADYDPSGVGRPKLSETL